MGNDIEVILVDDLCENQECYGKWRPAQNEILLQTPGPAAKKQVIMQSFWHETVHAILDCLGRTEMSSDEELVEQIGQCIAQVLKTKRNR